MSARRPSEEIMALRPQSTLSPRFLIVVPDPAWTMKTGLAVSMTNLTPLSPILVRFACRSRT